ncbi:MAG: hypothetical protein AAFV19_18315 [Pseudomonadota bacterium]
MTGPADPVGKVEFWPSRLIIGVTIFVWAVFTGGLIWFLAIWDLGPETWVVVLKATVSALMLALAIAHIRGSYFSGPSLVADRAGVIYRDASKVYGPIPWGAVSSLELDPPQPSRMVYLHLRAPVRRRSIIGLSWLVGDEEISVDALSIPTYAVDNQPEAAYAALVALFEAPRS